jgi:hypothetical protein
MLSKYAFTLDHAIFFVALEVDAARADDPSTSLSPDVNDNNAVENELGDLSSSESEINTNSDDDEDDDPAGLILPLQPGFQRIDPVADTGSTLLL